MTLGLSLCYRRLTFISSHCMKRASGETTFPCTSLKHDQWSTIKDMSCELDILQDGKLCADYNEVEPLLDSRK